MSIGLLAIACLAAVAQVHIALPIAPDMPGEVSLGFELQGAMLPKIALNIALTLPIYVAWRRWRLA